MAISPLKNEKELLAKIALGDERAFKELFEGYYNVLGEYVFKLTDSLEQAQEIVQDTFVKIWIKRQELVEVNNFNNYIFIICRNHIYNALRQKATERKILKFMDQNLIEDIGETDSNDNIDAYRELINAAIEKLPPQAQRVYLLSRNERMKHEEIAISLNISKETVKKHIQYAQKFITKDVQSSISGAILTVLLSPLIIS